MVKAIDFMNYFSVCYKHDNVFFGADAWAPRQFAPSIIKFLDGWGRKKSVWGTNGLPFKLPVVS